MNILEAITERRSIREFQNKPISRKIIENILEMTVKAPSGKNRQPWRFVILQDNNKNKLVTIMEQNVKYRKLQNLEIGSCELSINAINQAPIVILVFNPYSKFENDYNHYRLLTDTQSIGAAIHTMILTSENYGLGTLWICDVLSAEREIRTWLNRKDELVAALAIGYPNQSPYPRLRNSWQEITEWL